MPVSLCDAFQITAAIDHSAVALRTPDDTVAVTWGDYRDRVKAIASGLAALGVTRNDTVALMLTNRPEFHLVDTAALHLGAIPFSIYNTSSPEQVRQLAPLVWLIGKVQSGKTSIVRAVIATSKAALRQPDRDRLADPAARSRYKCLPPLRHFPLPLH